MDDDSSKIYDIRHGSYAFDGSAAHFHEWQFCV